MRKTLFQFPLSTGEYRSEKTPPLDDELVTPTLPGTELITEVAGGVANGALGEVHEAGGRTMGEEGVAMDLEEVLVQKEMRLIVVAKCAVQMDSAERAEVTAEQSGTPIAEQPVSGKQPDPPTAEQPNTGTQPDTLMAEAVSGKQPDTVSIEKPVALLGRQPSTLLAGQPAHPPEKLPAADAFPLVDTKQPELTNTEVKEFSVAAFLSTQPIWKATPIQEVSIIMAMRGISSAKVSN